MKRVVRTAAVGLLMSGMAAPVTGQLPEAEALVERYEQEIGVAGNPYEGISSIRTSMNVSMPAEGMAFDVRIDAVLPETFVTRVNVPGIGEVLTGFDGTVAWAVDPVQGARVLQGGEEMQASMQAQEIMKPGIKDKFFGLQTTGEDEVDGRKCWVVSFSWILNVSGDACFDAETGLLVKQTISQGGVDVETFFYDYKAFGPVKLASRTVVRAAGQEQVMTIENVEYDAVDPAAVAVPPEVQKLIKG